MRLIDALKLQPGDQVSYRGRESTEVLSVGGIYYNRKKNVVTVYAGDKYRHDYEADHRDLVIISQVLI